MLLSLYPVLVKHLPVSLDLQVWSRLFVYSVISVVFIDPEFVSIKLMSPDGIILSIVTGIHVYSSYQGFRLLESGTAYTLFYTYPLLILLFSGEPIHPMIFMAVVGVALLYCPDGSPPNVYGMCMIGIAAITESVIYYVVRRLRTDNNWNHLFISYFAGSLVMSVVFRKQIIANIGTRPVSMSLLSNGVIGLFGYYLRFFAISRLPTTLYASLSYFGVIMSHVYGILIGSEQMTLFKAAGTLCILIANFFNT